MTQIDPAVMDHTAASERAAFATTARLFSCLVTEGLVRALYIPLKSPGAIGICAIFNGNEATSSDLLVVIPLVHVPVFKHGAVDDERGREIGLLDPMDMMRLVYHVHETNVTNGTTVPKDQVRLLTHSSIHSSERRPSYQHLFSTPYS